VPTGQTGAARTDARAALDAIGERLRTGDGNPPSSAPAAPQAPGRPAVVGDRVLVGPFGVEGVVKAVHDRDAEVDVRGKRLKARLDELRVVAAAGSAKPAPVRVNVDLQPREGSLTELNVIGCNVDEALARAERFLDDALVSELRTVRLIHGYGTGQLRRALAGYLQGHPMVAHFAPAPPEQGGGGVTVVEFKE
jgi:DNA mismatch repair protein MutS2